MSVKSIVTSPGKFTYEQYHFSNAMLADGFLFCSGVLGLDEQAKPPADLETEFTLAFEAVGEVLKAAGGDFSNIIEYTTYHVGLQENMASFMAVRDRYLKAPWAAWTAIGITELAVPGAHVEIRVTAKI